MSEPSFNEDAPNFWAMTDEAWASFQMWKAHNPGAPETALAGLDFQPVCDSCEFVPAEHYLHFHPVNRCGVFQNRRQELIVCDGCLEEIEAKSVLILSELQAWSWILPWKKSQCTGCGRHIQLVSDVLELVRKIS
jgi:hypothetical protein